jgi:hypothetical protein
MAAKQLYLTHKGKRYTLEYNRNSIRQMERQGFKINESDNMPMTTVMGLFNGAFLMHHRNIDPQTLDALYDTVPNKENFIAKLSEMYSEPMLALVGEPEGNEGNTTWEASW